MERPWESPEMSGPNINGTTSNRPIGYRALWESVERPWESPEVSGPVRWVGLLTAGTAVPNKEWDRSSFLIRLYGFVPLHPLLL